VRIRWTNFEYRRAGIYRYSINASLAHATARQSFSSLAVLGIFGDEILTKLDPAR
jgi:hypothetical protein